MPLIVATRGCSTTVCHHELPGRADQRRAVVHVLCVCLCGVAVLEPPGLLNFLLNAVGGCLVVVWLMICFSYLKLHPELEQEGNVSGSHVGLPVVAVADHHQHSGAYCAHAVRPGSRSQVTSVAIVFAFLVALSFIPRKVA